MRPWDSHLAIGLLLSLQLGCLILPYKPEEPLPRKDAIRTLDPSIETRSSLRSKLGPPNVIDLPSVAAWEWEGDRTDILWFAGWVYGGKGGRLQGAPKVFRVLARFEGDRVLSVERDVAASRMRNVPNDPDQVWGGWGGDAKRKRGSLLPPLETIPLERGCVFKNLQILKDGQIFGLDASGALWSGQAGRGGRLDRLLAPSGPAALSEAGESSLAVDPGGRYIALASQGRLQIWDHLEKRLVLRMEGAGPGPDGSRMGVIRGVAFAPDGRWLAVLGDQASTLLEAGTWRPGTSLAWRGRASRLAFSPDGRRLVVQGERLRIFDVESGQLISDLSDSSEGELAMWGARLLVAGWNAQVVDLETGQELGRLRGTPSASTPAVRFTEEGTPWIYRRETLERWSLASLEQSFAQGQGTVDLKGSVDLAALQEVRMVPISPADLFSFYKVEFRLISPDGRWLVDYWHPYLSILSTATMQPLGYVHVSGSRGVTLFGFSEGGRLFVATEGDLRFWDLGLAPPKIPSAAKR